MQRLDRNKMTFQSIYDWYLSVYKNSNKTNITFNTF